MTARFVDEQSFDAPVADLFALLTHPPFQEARSLHLGSVEARCAVEGRTVTLDEVRDTGFGDRRFESRFVTQWSEPGPREARGAWELVQTAGPGHARAAGTVRITPVGSSRCRLVVEGTLTIRVSVPLVGPAIERIAVRGLRAHRRKEARFVAEALARRGAPGGP
jgi:hypothetical protein